MDLFGTPDIYTTCRLCGNQHTGHAIELPWHDQFPDIPAGKMAKGSLPGWGLDLEILDQPVAVLRNRFEIQEDSGT